MVAVPVQSKRALSRLDKPRIARKELAKERFADALSKSLRLLEKADVEHGNVFRAARHFNRNASLMENLHAMAMSYNSMARIGMHYAETHAILEFVSKGDLNGKRILHLGASTGVYARFLHDYCGADAVALDNNKKAVAEARARGAKKAVHGNAIPMRVRQKPVSLSQGKGVWIPREKRTPLRFPTASFDYIISEHFLFSNFHGEYNKDPGFERRPGSFEESELALKEYNRLLSKGGRIVVTSAHRHELADLGKYRRWFKIHGFIVEKIFDEYFEYRDYKTGGLPQSEHPFKVGPAEFVLKKINNV